MWSVGIVGGVGRSVGRPSVKKWLSFFSCAMKSNQTNHTGQHQPPPTNQIKMSSAKQVSRKRARRGVPTFKSYIHKVLKQVHPDTGITSIGMTVSNDIVNDLFHRLASEGSMFVRSAKMKTFNVQAAQSAARVVLAGELAKHAVAEGAKAVLKHAKSADVASKERTTLSKKAGLIFPVARVHRMLKENRVAARVSVKAAVYIAAVLEYVAGEFLELAGNTTHEGKKQRINSRFLLLTLEGDDELAKLIGGGVVARGGVVPRILTALLPPAKKSKKSQE